MIIANPIYDVVFKKLMEDERVARFFIGTLLSEPVEMVQLQPQEFTYQDEMAGIAIFRLDFIATIRTESGEYKKVLIEIQKARNQIDLVRFRNYLGEQYRKQDTVEGRKTTLPITTIYILGFTLPEIATPAVRVKRDYVDLVSNTVLPKKSEFVEKLSHDCFIVQVERITSRYQTRLDKLLAVFEQSYFVDNTGIIKEFRHPADSEGVKLMTDLLHHAGTNPEERRKIEVEEEAWRTINSQFEDIYGARLAAKDKELDEKNRQLDEKNALIEELKRKLGLS